MNFSGLNKEEKSLITAIYVRKGFTVSFDDEAKKIVFKKNGKEYTFSQKMFAFDDWASTSEV